MSPKETVPTPRGAGSGAVAGGAERILVEVAVPIPLRYPLTYSLPPGLDSWVKEGSRVGVTVGNRRMNGIVVQVGADAPRSGAQLRPLTQLFELEPLLPPELLRLGRFVSEYYLAPIGEVFRIIAPPFQAKEPVVRLLEPGLFNRADSSAIEGRVLETLMKAGGEMRLMELAMAVPDLDLPVVLKRWVRESRISGFDDSRRTSARFQAVFDLSPGALAEHIEKAGRSPKARSVIQHLELLGRPLTAAELTDETGCTRAVLRRLQQKGILRQGDQPVRLGLERHRMAPVQAQEPLRLRADQSAALAPVVKALSKRSHAVFLLAGMTGSGKTEVYLRAVETARSLGRGAILMVPEIALVPTLARELHARFGDSVAVLHSNLSTSERKQEWLRVRNGEATVVVGPRSAVFAPVHDLGLIVVDEEHDSSYKQETVPRYSGRDLAIWRARDNHAVALLTSATPSMESRVNVNRGKAEAVRLVERVGAGGLPEGIVVDLRTERYTHRPGEIHYSDTLLRETARSLDLGEQVIFLRNRRGYSPLLLCRSCGEDFRCADCGLPRTLHRRAQQLLCHYCGSRRPVPKSCERCGERALEAIGAGTERVEEEIRRLFPGITVDVLDRDAVARTGGAAAVLQRFRDGRSQILIGTQMVAKGHHFPNVTLTGVLSADSYLGFPDFRAVERTYNLLVQIAGRAGRGERPGRFVIQTHYPDHYAVQAVLTGDEERFVAEEMRFRQMFHYPPFSRMAMLLVRDANRARAEQGARDLYSALELETRRRGYRLAGPAPAPLERLQGKWRYQIALRGPSARGLQQILQRSGILDSKIDLVVDIDPQDLL